MKGMALGTRDREPRAMAGRHGGGLRMLALVGAACLVAAGCSRERALPDQRRDSVGVSSVRFADRVWAVDSSSAVAKGTLYVFLSDSTLLITSPNGTPLLGTWTHDGEALDVVEEGIHYRVEIVELQPDRFHIRSHNPGTAVDIWLVPAVSVGDQSAPNGLLGTAWRLEDLGGERVIADAPATLQFPGAGRASGRGSCNRFSASVEISGNSIRFGPIVSTKMACAGAVNVQEGRYFKALGDATRFELTGSALLIYGKGMDKPLRFARAVR